MSAIASTPGAQKSGSGRGGSRVVKLTAERLLSHAEKLEEIGRRAAERPIVGREARALCKLVTALEQWAQETEPRMSTAQFVHAAQSLGTNREMRRLVAERRTASFRAFLGTVDDTGIRENERATGEKNDNNDIAQHERNVPQEGSSREAVEQTTAAPQLGEHRVAEPLDMDIDPADVIECTTVARPMNVSREERAASTNTDGIDSHKQDIELTNRDTTGSSGVVAGTGNDYGTNGSNEQEEDDYDMEILREFESGGK